jgi:formylglycine-generating enzyme required for sulfatase activity
MRLLVVGELEVYNLNLKSIIMKKIRLILILLLFSNLVKANNLNISAPTYNSETLSFTISWENSWNINVGPSNFDAVWIFVKRQKCGDTNNRWVHQLLSTIINDHSAKVSGVTSTVVSVVPVSDGMGVFIKRLPDANSSNPPNAIGNVTTQIITLKLGATNPSILPTSDDTQDNFKVIGIEMVYVPEGEFYIGDGRSVNSNNFSAGNTNQPLKITNTIQNVNGLGSYTNYTNASAYGCPISLSKNFPLGYNGFFVMKYELLQGQFIEYLNTINYDQQALRLKPWDNTKNPNSSGTVYFANGSGTNVYISTPGIYNNKPATFSTNYSWLPMGYMNWQDLTAYLDWSGLRPMTEFEFEKACRGNNGGSANATIANEYPWGNTSITQPGGHSFNSTQTWPAYEGSCNFQLNALIRAGAFATATSNRSQSGATYYGIMEMGGNVFEQCVGGGSGYDYSGFRTTNGNGVLSNDGLADVIGWPTNGGPNSGTVIRGGYFYSNNNKNQIEVSDRTFFSGSTNNDDVNRDYHTGGRGVRSF